VQFAGWIKVIDITLIFFVLILLLALDLVAIAARGSFLRTSQARLLAQKDQIGEQVTKTVAMLLALPRLRASLNLALILTRFSLAGLALLILFLKPPASSTLASAIVLLVMAILVFWLEWIVERNVSRAPETWALRLTGFVRVMMALASFLLVPLLLFSEESDMLEAPSIVTEDELKTLVDAGQEEGIFEQGERRMIYSIFQLGDTLTREIMVPRIDMLALDADTPLPEAVDALLRSGYSRVPVFEESVDNTLGVLYAKDLLRAWREGEQVETLRELLRDAYFVPEAKKVDELLAEMQSRRIHMAIVVDEYGGVAGLVTLEDIVEEILGEIQDEYDQGEEAPYQELAEGDGYIFLGRIDLDDFNELMDSDLPSDEADTLGGYIYSRLGRVPTVGEKVQTETLLLTVEQVSARRIRKVSARWMPVDEREKETNRADR
jgi:CBS domain containing-hemolysin-like protein